MLVALQPISQPWPIEPIGPIDFSAPQGPQIFLICSSSSIFLLISETAVSTRFKGPGAFPSSRLDLHRNFEPDGMVHVDFRQFPTHFVADLQFSTQN